MLVLSRKVNERIVITDKRTGEVIRVMIVDIRGEKVRLGFEAEEVRYAIHREEVQEQIDQDKRLSDRG